jgi:hypothetical protein
MIPAHLQETVAKYRAQDRSWQSEQNKRKQKKKKKKKKKYFVNFK